MSMLSSLSTSGPPNEWMQIAFILAIAKLRFDVCTAAEPTPRARRGSAYLALPTRYSLCRRSARAVTMTMSCFRSEHEYERIGSRYQIRDSCQNGTHSRLAKKREAAREADR